MIRENVGRDVMKFGTQAYETSGKPDELEIRQGIDTNTLYEKMWNKLLENPVKAHKVQT